MSVLIWIQTVCKCYQQTTKVQNYFFQKILSGTHSIRMSNSLDPDQDQRSADTPERIFEKIDFEKISRQQKSILSILILVQAVCKGYQQTTKIAANGDLDFSKEGVEF